MAKIEKINKTREQLKELFLASFKEEKLPWNCPFQANEPPFGAHQNGISHKSYRGGNALLLWLISQKNSYRDSRWCTYNQAKKSGWQILKGSKGVPIEYWAVYDTKNKVNLTLPEAAQKINENPEIEKYFKLHCKNFVVFNFEQVDGAPQLEKMEFAKPFTNQMLHDTVKTYATQTGILFKKSETGAYYSPKRDEIHMPPKANFVSEEAYYATAFHECAHSTGHESRLNRELTNHFGDEKYAEEELRAEIASLYILAETGTKIPEALTENSKAYVGSWGQIIQKDVAILFTAIKSAEKICSYFCDKSNLKLIKEQLMGKEKSIQKEACPAKEMIL